MTSVLNTKHKISFTGASHSDNGGLRREAVALAISYHTYSSKTTMAPTRGADNASGRVGLVCAVIQSS